MMKLQHSIEVWFDFDGTADEGRQNNNSINVDGGVNYDKFHIDVSGNVNIDHVKRRILFYWVSRKFAAKEIKKFFLHSLLFRLE